MNVGAHVRGGGKLIPSLELGDEIGATSIQVFTQSPRMWKPSQYAPEVLAAYRVAQAEHPTISDTFCHATYLINLASGDLELYEKSVACLTHNLSVARGIGSSGLVLHVGSHKGAGFDDVVRQIADAFERALADADPAPEGIADCPILIENAAGSGGTVGRSFEEIAFLIDACNGDDRLGLCIDTQHLWASGFDYATVDGAERLVSEVDRTVGLERLRCFHFNDSKTELGGNRDRHANIGEGTIGAKGLAPLVGHPRIRDLPLLLEVPGDGDGPRAEDVAAGKRVVAEGIALYDGPTSASAKAAKVEASSSVRVSPPSKAAKKVAAKPAANAKQVVKNTQAPTTRPSATSPVTTARKSTSTKKIVKRSGPAKKKLAAKSPAKKAATNSPPLKSKSPTKTTATPTKKRATKSAPATKSAAARAKAPAKKAPKKTAKKK